MLNIICLILLSVGILHSDDIAISGDISVYSNNYGDITSIGGGKLSASALWGLAKFSGSVGNKNNTVTNINSLIIKGQVKVTGKIHLNSINHGDIDNMGSKVNVGSILIEN